MIEALYRIIDDHEIRFIERDLTSIHPELKGLYFDNVIVLDEKIDTYAEKTCILAEEIGHHFTSVGDILDTSNLHKEKEEEKSRRYASKLMFNPVRLIDAFKAGVSSRWELSQFLDLTEGFIEETLSYFKKFYGESLAIDEYVIHFDPLWVYKSFE